MVIEDTVICDDWKLKIQRFGGGTPTFCQGIATALSGTVVSAALGTP